jgi:hypothetical protein
LYHCIKLNGDAVIFDLRFAGRRADVNQDVHEVAGRLGAGGA